MPELPEVETTLRGLQEHVLKRTFVGAWSDWEKMVKIPKSFTRFKKELKGKKIQRIWRRGKNIIFDLSGDYSLLIHQKMAGHLLVGTWKRVHGAWKPAAEGPLQEPINLFLHLILSLDNGSMIGLSDYRKFAKAELWKTDELLRSEGLAKMGPEPLEKSFTLAKFKACFKGKRGKVKQVIMDPVVIAGVGNIYSSEALWWAKIHPERDVSTLNDKELKALYEATRKVLKEGVALGGESFADYRNVDGEKGHFDGARKAYKREKQPCFRCKTPMIRKKIGGRSAYFCPVCQTL